MGVSLYCTAVVRCSKDTFLEAGFFFLAIGLGGTSHDETARFSLGVGGDLRITKSISYKAGLASFLHLNV